MVCYLADDGARIRRKYFGREHEHIQIQDWIWIGVSLVAPTLVAAQIGQRGAFPTQEEVERSGMIRLNVVIEMGTNMLEYCW